MMVDPPFFRRAVWGVMLILLISFSTWETRIQPSLYYILPLDILVGLTCLVCLGLTFCHRRLRLSAALATFAHCLATILIGLCRNQSSLPILPCFPAAMQMMAVCASLPDDPLGLQTVSSLVAIGTAVIAFPTEFVQPIPLTFMVAALLLTFVTSMNGCKPNAQMSAMTSQVIPVRTRNFSMFSKFGPPLPDLLTRVLPATRTSDAAEAEAISTSEAVDPHPVTSYPVTALSVDIANFIEPIQPRATFSLCDLKGLGLNRPQGITSSCSLPPPPPITPSLPAFPLSQVVVDPPICQPRPFMVTKDLVLDSISKGSQISSSTPPLPTDGSSKSNLALSSMRFPQIATTPNILNSILAESQPSANATTPKRESENGWSHRPSLLKSAEGQTSRTSPGESEVDGTQTQNARTPLSVVQDVFAFRYLELKELYDTEVVARKKADIDFIEEKHRASELKSKYDTIEIRMNEAVASKEKSDCDLKTERKETARMKSKFDDLKVKFDEQSDVQQKAHADLAEQTNATAEMKLQLDAMTKTRDDEIIKHEKTEQQLKTERKETADMKLKFDDLKLKFDEQTDAQQKTQAELADQIDNAAEMKLQFDAVVKVRQDEVALHEKTAQELVAQLEQNSEMKLKYDSAHETMLEAVEGKRVADEDFDRQSVAFHEVTGKMENLNRAYQRNLAEKLKADDDLRVEVQKNEAAKERFDSLKDAHDQNVLLKVKADQALMDQCGKTKETQQLYSSLKTKYDKQKRQCSDQQECLVRASNQIKCLRWMLPDKAQAEVDGMPQFADPSLAAALQKPAQSDARSEVSAAPSSHEGHSAFQEAHSYHSSITNISHDMRTPLTTALMALEILMDEHVKLDERDRTDLLQKAWAALQNVLILINNVLDHSKLNSSGIRALPKQFNIRRLAIQVLRALEIQAKQNEIELILDASSSVPSSIQCDRLLLHRILMNLVANALKFSHRKGHVILSLRFLDLSQSLVISIIDNGIGMTTSEQGSIFKEFYQALHGKGGTGLGLSISHQLVKELNGTISASSEGKGFGSTFRVEIPVPITKRVSHTVDCVALIIDSDTIRYHALSEMLKYAGVYILDPVTDDPQALSPSVVFISFLTVGWQDVAAEWRKSSVAICLLVPNHCLGPSSNSADFGLFDVMLRSPVDIAELRGVLRSATGVMQSDTASQVSPSAAAISTASATNEAPPSHEACETPPGGNSPDHNLDEVSVLLAEDNAVNHLLFIRQLRNAELSNVQSAHNGLEAVQLAQKHKFSIIVMDCEMPVLSGFEAAKQIRQFPNHTQTPIVALTANHSPEVIERCRGCGMTEFFTKPVTSQTWKAIAKIARGWASASPRNVASLP